MRNLFLIIFSLVFLISCDNKFKYEKVISENISGSIYETYLVSNLTYSPKFSDSILLRITKNRIIQICKKDTTMVSFGCTFYDDISCTRRYFKNYEHLKGIEHIIERCEDYYWGSFTYEKSTKNNKQ